MTIAGQAAQPLARSCLIVKLGAIGDVLMVVPAAHELSRAGFQVHWVCGAAVEPVLRCYPWIDPIVADERALLTGSSTARLAALTGLWRRLVGRTFDLVATLYYDRRYRVLTLPVGAHRRLMLSRTARAARLLPGRHHSDEYARLLLQRPDQVTPCPIAPVRARCLPESPVPRTARRRVVLAPAGARNLLNEDRLRRWPAEQYVALAGQLIAAGIEVVLIGGPDDAWVQPSFAHLPVIDRIGTLPLPQTLALLDQADVLVTHDTGPLHLGGVTRVGIVSIFGPTDPRGRLPQRPGTVALWGGEGFACRPCYDAHSFPPCPSNDCMRQITVDRVLGEVHAMLAERAGGVLQPPRILTPESTVGSGRLVSLQAAHPEAR